MTASIQVASGRLVTIPPLSDDDIVMTDIAHALARTCRFGGHTTGFYSVAQHCVLAAYVAPPEMKLAALLHDAEEAYLPDVPTPIKQLPELEGYRKLATQTRERILQRFDLPTTLPPAIKSIDARLLVTEARDVLRNGATNGWDEAFGIPYTFAISPWSFEFAEQQYLKACEAIMRRNFEALEDIALATEPARALPDENIHDANCSFAGGVWNLFCTCTTFRGQSAHEPEARRAVYLHLLAVGHRERAKTYRLHFGLGYDCGNCDDGDNVADAPYECYVLGHVKKTA